MLLICTSRCWRDPHGRHSSTFYAGLGQLAPATGRGAALARQLSDQLGGRLPVLAQVVAHDALPPLLPHRLLDAPVLPHLHIRR